MIKKLAFCGLMFTFMLSSLYCYARDYPSDVDLKTAYCIKVKQNLIKILTPFSNLQEFAAPYQEEVKKLNRMRTYLGPKYQYLKIEPLIIAAKNAEQDIADSEKSLKFCSRKYPNPTKPTMEHEVLYKNCVEEENKMDSGYDARQARIYSCEDPSWLPY